MRTPIITAALAAIAMLTLAACTTSNTIQGQKIRGSAEPVVQTADVTGGLHDDAPQWFKNYWRAYLRHVDGGYGTLAVDRNGLGAGYVYCLGSAGCANNASSQWRAFTDVSYKHRALKDCNRYVRNTYPTKRPDCAIYAINDKIVWKGKLPWQ